MAGDTPDRPSTLRTALLVIRCQAGDDAAFSRLMGQLGPPTLAYLRGLLGDGAEDVHQEVWATVYRRIRELENPRAFVTWLFRTTRHRAIDRLRTLRRERELFEPLTDATAEADTGPEPTGWPDEAELERVIVQLPAIHREIVLLRHRDDLSYAEIAAVLGCSIGTVRSRLHHARRRLQLLLDDSNQRPSPGAPHE